jgi:acyl carrier protein
MEELKQRLKKVIISELHLDGVEPASIANDAPLFGTGLGLDSLDALQLAVAVEENFGVRIGDEAEGKKAFASVDALAAYISAHAPASAAPA